MIERQIDSPIPIPPDLVVKKGLNRSVHILGGDPDAAIRHTDERLATRPGLIGPTVRAADP
jgi:hypothetical protein